MQLRKKKSSCIKHFQSLKRNHNPTVRPHWETIHTVEKYKKWNRQRTKKKKKKTEPPTKIKKKIKQKHREHRSSCKAFSSGKPKRKQKGFEFSQ